MLPFFDDMNFLGLCANTNGEHKTRSYRTILYTHFLYL